MPTYPPRASLEERAVVAGELAPDDAFCSPVRRTLPELFPRPAPRDGGDRSRDGREAEDPEEELLPLELDDVLELIGPDVFAARSSLSDHQRLGFQLRRIDAVSVFARNPGQKQWSANRQAG